MADIKIGYSSKQQVAELIAEQDKLLYVLQLVRGCTGIDPKQNAALLEDVRECLQRSQSMIKSELEVKHQAQIKIENV